MIWSAGLGLPSMPWPFHGALSTTITTTSWTAIRTETCWGKLFQHDFQREGGFCVLFLLGIMETEPNPQPKFSELDTKLIKYALPFSCWENHRELCHRLTCSQIISSIFIIWEHSRLSVHFWQLLSVAWFVPIPYGSKILCLIFKLLRKSMLHRRNCEQENQ
jgi:hypothetical protein